MAIPADKATVVPQLSIFLTEIGWCGLAGRGQSVARLTIGHISLESVRDELQPLLSGENGPAAETDWFPELRRALERYARGERVDFGEFAVETPAGTEFQRRVLAATRAIGYGETRTYAQLAAQAGRPGAARAVGNVMASNRVPILIPCHRVVATGGRLGGFSSPQGVGLKQRLLQMESTVTPSTI